MGQVRINKLELVKIRKKDSSPATMKSRFFPFYFVYFLMALAF